MRYRFDVGEEQDGGLYVRSGGGWSEMEVG